MGNRSTWGLWMDIFFNVIVFYVSPDSSSDCPADTAACYWIHSTAGSNSAVIISSAVSVWKFYKACLCNVTWTGVEVKNHDWWIKIWWNVKSHSTLRLLLFAPESSSLKNHNLLRINEMRCRTAEWSQIHKKSVYVHTWSFVCMFATCTALVHLGTDWWIPEFFSHLWLATFGLWYRMFTCITWCYETWNQVVRCWLQVRVIIKLQ